MKFSPYQILFCTDWFRVPPVASNKAKDLGTLFKSVSRKFKLQPWFCQWHYHYNVGSEMHKAAFFMFFLMLRVPGVALFSKEITLFFPILVSQIFMFTTPSPWGNVKNFNNSVKFYIYVLVLTFVYVCEVYELTFNSSVKFLDVGKLMFRILLSLLCFSECPKVMGW